MLYKILIEGDVESVATEMELCPHDAMVVRELVERINIEGSKGHGYSPEMFINIAE